MKKSVPPLLAIPLFWVVLAALLIACGGMAWSLARHQTVATLVFLMAFVIFAIVGSMLHAVRGARMREDEAVAIEAQTRRDAQEAAKLALVAEYTTNSIILTDAAGIVEWVNGTFLRQTGYEAADILGNDVTMLWGPNTGEGVRTAFTETLQKGTSLKTEMLRYGKNGFSYWVQSETCPIRSDGGEVTHFLLVENEITDFKLYESALIKAREAAESAAHAKSEFLAMMSHEIRTPLNAVLGFAGLLEETKLDPRQREYLKTVRSSGSSLLHLLDDILDFSRMEAGTLSLGSQVFDPQQAALEVLHLYEGTAEEKGIRLRIQFASKMPPYVEMDGRRLRQILVNLVGNAVKFTSAGEVFLEVRARAYPGEEVTLTFLVRDTGIGIPPEQIDDIFHPFKQLDSSPARRFGGTGLGLAIARRLAHLMGGRIEVSSRINDGSSFLLTVPAKTSFGELAEEPEIRSPVARPLKILVAEDNLVNRKLIHHMLQKLGHEANLVMDGVECVSAAMSREYDMILMDVQMPNMDGLEACQRLREAGIETPIVAVTAHAMPEDNDRCLAVGMNDYLAKPLAPDALQKVIQRFVVADERASAKSP